jgi:hypothetical protein
MPDLPSDPDQPDSENNLPEAPAVRPAPLQQQTDKADAGCLVMLFVLFIAVFLFPAVLLLGGAPVIIPLILCLLMVLATPFMNPMERRSGPSKWWGRGITFLVLAGAVVAVWIWWWQRSREDHPFDIRQEGSRGPLWSHPGTPAGWS